MVAASRDGVIFLPPHVNGTSLFSVEDNAIRIGTSSLKNIGEKSAEAIQANRPYASVDDLHGRVSRRQANARVVDALARAGALEFDRDAQIAQAIALNKELREAKINFNVYSREGLE